MKKIVKLFILFTCTVSQLFGQNPEKFEHGEMRIANDTYEVVILNNSGVIGIANESKNTIINIKSLDIQEPLQVYPPDLDLDTQADQRIVFAVLAEKLHLLKENKEFIKIFYAFNPKGDIMVLQYTISNKTLITPTEIALIDSRIRNEIKGRFLTGGYEAWPIIYHSSRPWIYF